MSSNPLILCHPLLLLPLIFRSIRVFFASGGQSTGVSASASVLPMYIQDWFPLGWTGLISLQSKGLSRVFSNTTVRKHQFFGVPPSLWSNSHIRHDYWKNHSPDYMIFVGKVMSLLFNTLLLHCITVLLQCLGYWDKNYFHSSLVTNMTEAIHISQCQWVKFLGENFSLHYLPN